MNFRIQLKIRLQMCNAFLYTTENLYTAELWYTAENLYTAEHLYICKSYYKNMPFPLSSMGFPCGFLWLPVVLTALLHRYCRKKT